MTSFVKIFALSFCLCATALSFAEESPVGSISDKVSVYSAPEMDAKILAEAVVAVAKYTRLTLSVVGQWDQAEGLHVERDFAHIVFVDSLKDGVALHVDSEQRAIRINYGAIKDADGVLVQRRVERLMMRGIAEVCKLGFCPNGQCCLFHYHAISQLDQIGRNFCPPCSLRYDSKMKELKIPLSDPRALFLQHMKELQKAQSQKK